MKELFPVEIQENFVQTLWIKRHKKTKIIYWVALFSEYESDSSYKQRISEHYPHHILIWCGLLLISMLGGFVRACILRLGFSTALSLSITQTFFGTAKGLMIKYA